MDSPTLPEWMSVMLEEETRSGKNKGFFDMARALAGVPEGQRDTEMFRLASLLRAKDVSREIAEGVVLFAARNCDSAFSEDEALAKVANAYERYQPNASSRN